MAKSKDLFDESTMSFGEHLEVLRYHLFMALIGVVLAVIVCLFFGYRLVDIVSAPINQALIEYRQDELTDDSKGSQEEKETSAVLQPNKMILVFRADDLRRQLFPQDPEKRPDQDDSSNTVRLEVSSEKIQQIVLSQSRLTTLKAEEAFMVYLKVSLVGGLILSSPWVFYQLWLFVAAGLYPHERRYVYFYMPISLFLFFTGVLFCFYWVFPLILKFLLGFNKAMGFDPQLRVSEWISFAVTLPLMFGISFQLPLVMLFLERISIFDVKTYREKRRISILVIAVISMLMTPTDPWSMLLMMFPLILLYELGIIMCIYSPRKVAFEGEE